MNEKEILLKTLAGEKTARPPVICPGGMMSAATTGVLTSLVPFAHLDPLVMAKAARAIQLATGFDNLGVPFCMTAEAEAFGSKVDLGTPEVEPHITGYLNLDYKQLVNKDIPQVNSGRMGTILQAIRELKKTETAKPIIGNVTGIMSLTTSVLDPMVFFRLMRKDPQGALEVLSYFNQFLLSFAKAQVEAGAEVITIADPTATGEIIGPNNFANLLAEHLRKLIEGINSAGVPVILHICGDASSLISELLELKAQALSFDAIINLPRLKKKFPQQVLMGNISTRFLHQATPERIRKTVARLIEAGVDIIAPSCGISLSIPLPNLRAVTDYVKAYNCN